MPKRPRTAESADVVSPFTTNSRWAIGRLAAFPSSNSTTNSAMITTGPASPQQSNSKMSRHRHSKSVNDALTTSSAPVQHQNRIQIPSSPNQTRGKPQGQSSPQQTTTSKSPSTVAKDIVQGLQFLLTGRRARSGDTKQQQQQRQKEMDIDDLAFLNADALQVGVWTPDQEYENHLRIREEYSRMITTSDDTTQDVEMDTSEDVPSSEPNDERSSRSSRSSSSSSSNDGISSPKFASPAGLLAQREEQRRNPDQHKPTLEDFDVLQTLGTGTFGRVLLVRKKRADVDDPRNYFAMKVLNKSQIIRLKQVEHINSERTILSKIDHPFIVHLEETFQDSINCYMMMEFVVGGEIFSHLRRAKRFSADVTRFYIACLVLAISHLHSRKIIYRDLKPENLLIDSKGYIKITDFGFSKELVDTDRTWTLCGTPEYLSPEVILSRSQSFASDWWCLGILMYEMLCGHPPFYDATPFGTYEKILAAEIRFPTHVDPVARDLIIALLTVDVTKRIGNLRGGANDVMNHAWFHRVNWNQLLKKELPAPFIPHQNHPSDSSNFDKYGQYDISNMPGMHIGMQADYQNRQSDPWKQLFTEF